MKAKAHEIEQAVAIARAIGKVGYQRLRAI
jgi:hypothetical protein